MLGFLLATGSEQQKKPAVKASANIYSTETEQSCSSGTFVFMTSVWLKELQF